MFQAYSPILREAAARILHILGIVPFVTSHLLGRFFVFFTVAFLLFLAPVGGSNPAGPIA